MGFITPRSKPSSATACRTTGQFSRRTFQGSRPSSILFTRWNISTQRRVAYEATRKNSGGFLQWTDACWQGRVREVISQLRAEQQRIGEPPADAAENDPRKIIADTIGYFQNNAPRMDYPAYRREGLPLTSALMESFVKELNQRVKGTEKFWNDGASGEAILQVRAAALCDDDRLQRHLKNRPGNPFRPNARRRPPAVANAS